MSLCDVEPKSIDCVEHIVAYWTLQTDVPAFLHKTQPQHLSVLALDGLGINNQKLLNKYQYVQII